MIYASVFTLVPLYGECIVGNIQMGMLLSPKGSLVGLVVSKSHACYLLGGAG